MDYVNHRARNHPGKFRGFRETHVFEIGPEKLSGVSRNGRQNRCTQETSDKKIPNSRPRFHRAQNLILAQTGEKNHILLRASVCEYRKPGASCEIFNFFIFCLNKPFSELFSKIQLKVPKALYSLGASVISCDFCERSKPPI